MTRYIFIDIAKGIGIVLVVFGHAAATADKSFYYYEPLIITSKMIFSFIMPFFFMISAVFLRHRLERINISTKEFLKKITLSILVPFYSLNLLFFFVNYFAQNHLDVPTAEKMIKALLLMQIDPAMLPSGILWFLFVLFMFTLCTVIFIKLMKVNLYVLVLFSIILRIFDYYFAQNTLLAINKISHYYIYYMAGYMLSEKIKNGSIFKSKAVLLSLCVCWLFSLYLKHSSVTLEYVDNIINGFGIVGLSGSLFLSSLSYYIYSKSSFNTILKFLSFCGANSILIYVFHLPTFYIIRGIAIYLNLSGSLSAFILVILCGVLFPLIYGKLLSCNVFVYKTLLGRNP